MSTSRREFICGAVGLAILGPTGCATAPSMRADVEGDTLRLDLSRWPEGERVVIARREDRKSPVIVVRDGDSFEALSSVCPHRGCIVKPKEDNLVCPCHGSVFGFDGTVQRGPAVDDLARLQTRVEDLELLIAAPASPI